jgi:hypothetical protein
MPVTAKVRLLASRWRTTAVISASKIVVTCGLVRLLITMCWAMARRIVRQRRQHVFSIEIGNRLRCGDAAPSSPAATSRAQAAGKVQASRSLRVMRPPNPVPETCARSTPCSAEMRATTGLMKCASGWAQLSLRSVSGDDLCGGAPHRGSCDGGGGRRGRAWMAIHRQRRSYPRRSLCQRLHGGAFRRRHFEQHAI